jgi:hypothetical protein
MVAKGKARAVWKVQGAKKVLAKGKAKAKAKPTGKAQAKGKAKANAKPTGKAQAKANAKPTGKAQAKGKAKTTGQIQQKTGVHKENLKEQINTMTNPGKPSLRDRAGSGRGKGWEEIQEGATSLTQRGCMVVLDKCRQLAKKVTRSPWKRSKHCPGAPRRWSSPCN